MVTEAMFVQFITDNTDIIDILRIVEKLELAQGCLCAGAIRNTVWNKLTHQENTLRSDVDVIFYDPDISYNETCLLEEKLLDEYPDYKWELKNQVYMHTHNQATQPYKSVEDALSKFPEVCTAIGVRLVNNEIEVIAPYGWEDIFQLKVQPTPYFKGNQERMSNYRERQKKKNWQQIWPELKIMDMEEE